MKPENVIYQGTFNDVAAGQQLAARCTTVASRPSSPLPVVLASARSTKPRHAPPRASGSSAWIVDQYAQGIYSGDKSIILTSAMKRTTRAAYDMIKAEKEKFRADRRVIFDAKKDGVGIPATNPEPSADVSTKVWLFWLTQGRQDHRCCGKRVT